MSQGAVIEVAGLSKRFGSPRNPRAVQAVAGLTFTVTPGRVMGFLGPNGSGKTTTLGMILGLIRPDEGQALINGKPYTDLERPATVVGSALTPAFHPGHTGRAHLEIMQRGMGLKKTAVDQALERVGLRKAANRKTGGYSLGMRQRLALAGALLAQPSTLILDEPANGLDPEGIKWMREFLRNLAQEGHTVLLSSHLLSEVRQTVDELVVIRQGERVFWGTPQELETDTGVGVASEDNPTLVRLITQAGGQVEAGEHQRIKVNGLDASTIGQIARDHRIALSYLAKEHTGLEDRFFQLIHNDTPGDAS